MFTGRPPVDYLIRLLFISALVLAGGCSASGADCIAGPGDAAEPLTVVFHNRWHTGIAFHRELLEERLPELKQFPDADIIEIGWGDRAYYMARPPSWYLALPALLWPTASVVQIMGFQGTATDYFGEDATIELSLSQKAADRAADFAARSIRRNGDRPAAPLGSGHYADSFFFPAKDGFHAANTCNTWVARLLQAAGCSLPWPLPVRAGGLRSLVEELRIAPGEQ